MRRLIQAVLGVSVLVGGLFVVVAVQPAQAVVTCEKFGTLSIQSGRYNVQNNVWGADTAQCIDTTANGFTVTQANHNKATNGAPASYPSVYFGCHYANCTAGSGLPLQASTSAFNGIRTSVGMTYPSAGTWDAAYDIWFDPTPRTDGQNTGAEIMVWLNRQGSIQPVGSQVGTANIAGSTWNVWFGNVGWNVVSYVRTSATNSLNFAVNDFYADAINRGHAQRSWYLTSIQAGFEPWVGGAGLAVNSFSVTTGGGGGGTTTTTPPPPPPPGGCRVSYSSSNWGGGNGFTGNLTVANTSSNTVNGWTLAFAFPAGQRITPPGWGATWNQPSGSANVTATPLDWNRSLAPNGSTSIGFNGTFSGSNPSPTGFTLNGTACAVG
jgi:Glycosyl hydrolase family 12/Cellulose binding domain